MQPFDGVSAPNPQIQQGSQQSGAYPSQPYVVYTQGVQSAQDIAQKQMLANQLMRNIRAPGKGLVILYSLFLVVTSILAIILYTNQNSYPLVETGYEKLSGKSYTLADSFLSSSSCQIYFAGILSVPNFLLIFAFFNLLAMCFSCCGTSCCMCFQIIASISWAGLAAYYYRVSCALTAVLTPVFGTSSIPQNAWPFYLGMAIASLIACLLNYSWSNNKDQAEKDQRNLALMMTV